MAQAVAGAAIMVGGLVVNYYQQQEQLDAQQEAAAKAAAQQRQYNAELFAIQQKEAIKKANDMVADSNVLQENADISRGMGKAGIAGQISTAAGQNISMNKQASKLAAKGNEANSTLNARAALSGVAKSGSQKILMDQVAGDSAEQVADVKNEIKTGMRQVSNGINTTLHGIGIEYKNAMFQRDEMREYAHDLAASYMEGGSAYESFTAAQNNSVAMQAIQDDLYESQQFQWGNPLDVLTLGFNLVSTGFQGAQMGMMMQQSWQSWTGQQPGYNPNIYEQTFGSPWQG